MLKADDYDSLFELLASSSSSHNCNGAFFKTLSALCEIAFRSGPFKSEERKEVAFGPFESIVFPYQKMGKIDSIDLFGLNELILFSFYYINRNIYKKSVDIGANVGLHTLLLSRCGLSVRAFEPDPNHFVMLSENVRQNALERVELIRAAVSDREGAAEFVRVKDNTTGSHLAGAKLNPYGPLDRLTVDVISFENACAGADIVKIDAEGHEVLILRSLPPRRWLSMDSIVEIGTADNALAIFEHFSDLPVQIFSQKIGWKVARSPLDLPSSHHEGSVFISAKPEMPWVLPY